jgi:hypothetical protein
VPQSSNQGETIVRRDFRIGVALSAALVVFVALGAAGCGSSTTSQSSPAASQSAAASPAGGYVAQSQAILAQVGTTASSLPDAIAGLSKQPDDTWITAGSKLVDASAALDKETTSLAALTPPAALQPVQDAVVKGLQKVHAKIEALSGLIYEESATEALQSGPIESQVAKLQAQLTALSTRLAAAAGSASPAP